MCYGPEQSLTATNIKTKEQWRCVSDCMRVAHWPVAERKRYAFFSFIRIVRTTSLTCAPLLMKKKKDV